MRRTGYGQLHRGIIGPRLRLLSGAEWKVLTALLIQACPKTYLCELSLGEIAEEAGVQRGKTGGYLYRLACEGLIDYEPGRNQYARTAISIAPAVGEVPVTPRQLMAECACPLTGTAACPKRGTARTDAVPQTDTAAVPSGGRQGVQHDPAEQSEREDEQDLELQPNEEPETGDVAASAHAGADAPSRTEQHARERAAAAMQAARDDLEAQGVL